jgi:hypothetical protein
VGVVWTESSQKHEVPREDVLLAIEHAVGSEEVEGRPGWKTRVWVGHPHPQTERYIEVLAAARGSEFVIFHAMTLSDVHRHLID